MKENAIVLTNGLLDKDFSKTSHGLIRGTERFNLLGIIDHVHAGRDAGEVLDGIHRGIQVYETIESFFKVSDQVPKYLVIGVAFPGGGLPDECRGVIIEAMKRGVSIVSGLHERLSDDDEFSAVAAEHDVELLDIRKSRPAKDLHFWNGEIYEVDTPKVAVLGTDCMIGKRTTCRFIMEGCRKAGLNAEMIFTGQTGWLQGNKYGFILDSTLNDFISGEIERAIVDCYRNESPDLILVEGQSSLQNPYGPCGSEFIISGNIKGVVLQHAPGRKYYKTKAPVGYEIAPIESEVALINAMGAEVLAVTLSELEATDEEMVVHQKEIAEKLDLPVIRPLVDGVEELTSIVMEYQKRTTQEGQISA